MDAGPILSPMARMGDWDRWLAAFPEAGSVLLAERELKRRTDTKFVLDRAGAERLLPQLAGDYAVLLAGTERIATYRTLYFDTPTLEHFHAHRRGRRVRHKVRIRHYPDRQLSALEVKTRRSELETNKARRARDYGDNQLSEADRAFVELHTHGTGDLLPQAWTNFRRVTLLGLRTRERVTIDLDLELDVDGTRRTLGSSVVVELKQWPYDRRSVAMCALRAGGWTPGHLSKYCTAIAWSRPDVRAARLRADLNDTLRSVA